MKWIAGLFALGFWAFSLGLGLTGFTTYQPHTATVAVTERGVARVTGCERSGPVTANGIGYWWICQADVVWDSGKREHVTAQPDQLTPDDKGDVPVVQRGERSPRGSRIPNGPVYHTDYEPSVLLGLGSALAGLAIGGLVALAIFGTLSRGKRS